jgi:hypothetical protein
MNYRQFKKEYFKTLCLLGLTSDQAAVSAGGSMLLYGLRRTTSDIDLDIPSALYDRLKESGQYEVKTFAPAPYAAEHLKYAPCTELIVFNKRVDLHRAEPSVHTFMWRGIRSWSGTDVRQQKRALGREKDQKDIKLLALWCAGIRNFKGMTPERIEELANRQLQPRSVPIRSVGESETCLYRPGALGGF